MTEKEELARCACGGAPALYAPDAGSETKYAASIVCHHCGVSMQMADHDSNPARVVAAWNNHRTPPARSIDAGDGYVLVPREPTEAMKTAGMDVLMYRIETITPSDLWRAMLAAAPSPPPAKKVGPTTNAAAFELSIYEGVRDRLARLTAGTCSCNTKSPELRYHSERCHYRVAREALDLLLAAPPPPAKEAE